MQTDERNNFTKLSQETAGDLARYGIMRDKAAKGAPIKADGKANLFGLSGGPKDYEMVFDATGQQIQRKKGMTLAMVAPENQTFDMLGTVEFKAKMKGTPVDKLRNFLLRVFNES